MIGLSVLGLSLRDRDKGTSINGKGYRDRDNGIGNRYEIIGINIKDRPRLICAKLRFKIQENGNILR